MDSLLDCDSTRTAKKRTELQCTIAYLEQSRFARRKSRRLDLQCDIPRMGSKKITKEVCTEEQEIYNHRRNPNHYPLPASEPRLGRPPLN
eukprot:3449122-Amphidinium_carterae.1